MDADAKRSVTPPLQRIKKDRHTIPLKIDRHTIPLNVSPNSGKTPVTLQPPLALTLQPPRLSNTDWYLVPDYVSPLFGGHE